MVQNNYDKFWKNIPIMNFFYFLFNNFIKLYNESIMNIQGICGISNKSLVNVVKGKLEKIYMYIHEAM